MAQGIKKISENVIAPGRSLTLVNNSVQDNKNFEIGTLKCYPTESGIRFKQADNTFSLFDAIYTLQPFSIEESLMDNNSISTRCIIDLNVTTPKLADLCVTNSKVQNKGYNAGIVAYEKIRDGSIITDTLGEQCVTNPKVKDKDINASQKIMSQSITTELLRGGMDINGIEVPGCVTTPKIADENVTTRKLYNKCVTNEKLADNSIENEKIKDFIIQGGNTAGTSKIAEKTITSFNIADKSLTDSKFANGCVTGYAINSNLKDTSVIADETITDTNIANNTITASKLASKTITGAASSDGGKIASLTITGDNIKDLSIPLSKLDDSISGAVSNAVLYEQDSENKTCVKLKGRNNDSCYMNISGHLDVVGNITGARVYNMAYSDLAEGYIPGEELEAGEIVELREDGKVYKATHSSSLDKTIVGVVSDEYAVCFGATEEELLSGEKVAVALIGRVHVKVNGLIRIGQRVGVGFEDGIGVAQGHYSVGKALESCNEFGEHKILCLIYPN